MPTLSIFFGIIIRMYWSDNDRHKPPISTPTMATMKPPSPLMVKSWLVPSSQADRPCQGLGTCP